MGRRGLASCAVLVVAGVAVAAQSPQTSAPRQTRAVAVGVADGTLLRSWDATVDAMRRGGELVLTRTRTDTVLAGRTHERYEQYFHGIRVVGGEVTRQLTRGVTSSIFGELHQVSGVSDRPEISEDAARDVFRAHDFDRSCRTTRPIELVILQKDDGTYALCVLDARVDERRVDADLHRRAERRPPAPLQRPRDTVRRGDGNRRPRRHEEDQHAASVRPLHCRRCAEAPGADYLRHCRGTWREPKTTWTGSTSRPRPTSRAIRTTCGRIPPLSMPTCISAIPTTTTSSASAVPASTIGMLPIYAITHPVRRSDFATLSFDDIDTYLLNAFWCGGCGPTFRGAMVFGDGLPPSISLGGQTFDFFSGALDIVAHELTHGLTELHVEPDLPQRVRRPQRGLLRHHGNQRRVLLPAAGKRPSAGRLPDRRRHHPPGRRSIAGESRVVRRSRPLFEAVHGIRRQRRRAHQFLASRTTRSTWRSKAAPTAPPVSRLRAWAARTGSRSKKCSIARSPS